MRGRRSFVTLATNSIKLHIDANKKDGTFLWIDPPWEFHQDGALIESSDSCPDHTDPDYDIRFRQWCEGFRPIHETAIAEIAATPDGALQIAFFGGGEIVVPADESYRDLWYDHWY